MGFHFISKVLLTPCSIALKEGAFKAGDDRAKRELFAEQPRDASLENFLR